MAKYLLRSFHHPPYTWAVPGIYIYMSSVIKIRSPACGFAAERVTTEPRELVLLHYDGKYTTCSFVRFSQVTTAYPKFTPL